MKEKVVIMYSRNWICHFLLPLSSRKASKIVNLPWFTGRLASYWACRGIPWTFVQSVIELRRDIVIWQSWKSCTKYDPQKWRHETEVGEWVENWRMIDVRRWKQERREKKIQISEWDFTSTCWANIPHLPLFLHH